MTNLIPKQRIEKLIWLIRDEKVMIDRDLAELYGVQTKVMIQAMKRNIKRFPSDFMFQLSDKEFKQWRSQFVTSNSSTKMGIRRKPYVFTEQGVSMLSSILNSNRAIEVNIAIIRTFVELRNMLSSHKELSKKLTSLENKYDSQFKMIFDAIRQLMASKKLDNKRQIGFNLENRDND